MHNMHMHTQHAHAHNNMHMTHVLIQTAQGALAGVNLSAEARNGVKFQPEPPTASAPPSGSAARPNA